MKKRTACKIIGGVVVACSVANAGYCGRITLEGSESTHVDVIAEITGTRLVEGARTYDANVGCAVCATYYGPCVSSHASDVRILSANNAADITTTSGVWAYGKKGTMIMWRPGNNHAASSAVSVRIRCDNHVRKDWNRVDVTFFRSARYPKSEIRISATNLQNGVTATSENGTWQGYAWDPGWGSVVGTPGSQGAVSLTYADDVKLEGYKSRARVIYDVVGAVPVTLRVDGSPEGLTCMRSSDGLSIAQGAIALIGAGDSITCVNTLKTTGTTVGALSITAMIR